VLRPMIRESVLVLGVLLGTGCKAAPSLQGPVAPASALAPASQPATPATAPSSANAGDSPLLAVGADVPDVSAVAQDGKTVKLRELKGKPVIVYFYPKDDTPGCTIEAKGIRDQYSDLNSRAVVLGVSTDTSESHKAFADKYNLPFQLLDDSSHALATAFGVPVSSGHAKRITFVIDAAGKIRKVFPNVNPDGHAAELLEALKSLS
jgi:peroxiredoxin Q/BCP